MAMDQRETYLKNYQLPICSDLLGLIPSQILTEVTTCTDQTTIKTLHVYSLKKTILESLEGNRSDPPSQHGVRVSSEDLGVHCKAGAIHHQGHFLWSYCLGTAA